MTLAQLASAPDFPDLLLERITALQSERGTFMAGLFPSYRRHRLPPYEVADDSVFFTAVILYALQSVREALSAESRETIERITRRAVATYPHYLNNQGLKIYNFWQTHPTERFFPNSSLLSRLRHFRLAEDADVTAYVYLTQPHMNEEVEALKTLLARHANGSEKGAVKHRLHPYRHLRAYNTWFGGMPLDLDVCVMTNILLFVRHHQLPLNEFDADTLRFIRAVLESDEHLRDPFRIAPWYPSTPLILYHVTRLMHRFAVPELNALREKLAADAQACALATASAMERLLLSLSLLHLGQPPLPDLYTAELEQEIGRYRFFSGSFLTVYDHPLPWALAPLPLFQFDFRCPAHSWALVLEHEVLRRTVGA